jgi:hypothetical protein
VTLRRASVSSLVAALTIGLVLAFAVGNVLTAPSRQSVPPPPDFLGAETVALSSPSGATLRAWLLVPDAPKAAVARLHGVRGASHDDLFRFDKAGYAAHVLDFLDRHLAGERARP